jgi:hypothetical protein
VRRAKEVFEMHWRLNHKRLDAARKRRDTGEAPLLWDNVLLSLSPATESLNVRPPRRPEPLPEDGVPHRVVALLRDRPMTVSDIEMIMRVGEIEVRQAIDVARQAGWWIECDGVEPHGRFYFVPISAAA